MPIYKKIVLFLFLLLVFFAYGAIDRGPVGFGDYSELTTMEEGSTLSLYSGLYEQLNRISIPFPIMDSNTDSASELMSDRALSLSGLSIKEAKVGINRLLKNSFKSYTSITNFSVSLNHGRMRYCFISHDNKDITSSDRGKKYTMSSEFIIFHELAHCYSDATGKSKINIPDPSSPISKSVFYSLANGDENLAKKIEKSYITMHEEAFSDIFALVFHYSKHKDALFIDNIETIRNNNLINRKSLAHWTSPIISASKKDIVMLVDNAKKVDSYWDISEKIFNSHYSSIPTEEGFVKMRELFVIGNMSPYDKRILLESGLIKNQ